MGTLTYTSPEGEVITAMLAAERAVEARPEYATVYDVLPFLRPMEPFLSSGGGWYLLFGLIAIVLVILFVRARKKMVRNHKRQMIYNAKRREYNRMEAERRQEEARRRREAQRAGKRPSAALQAARNRPDHARHLGRVRHPARVRRLEQDRRLGRDPELRRADRKIRTFSTCKIEEESA